MLVYILISGIINVIFCWYLLNVAQQEKVVDFVQARGAWRYYILAAITGCAVIPIYICIIFYVLFIEK
ncbi:hypothetical protein IJ425_04055 [bacterium]|nr:hypothetical protein [bacterium]